MLEWDTGASFILAPFKSDFVDYMGFDIPVKSVTKVNKVVVLVTTIHKFQNIKGDDVYLPWVSYDLPTDEICIFIPNHYQHIHGGNSSVYADRVKVHLSGHEVVLQID